jgi:hypothetical protein
MDRMNPSELQFLEGVDDERVCRTNDVAVSRNLGQRGNVEVVWMTVGNDEGIHRWELCRIDSPFGTRDDYPLLKGIGEDRVHEARSAFHLDQDGCVP